MSKQTPIRKNLKRKSFELRREVIKISFMKIWQDYLDEADHLRLTEINKSIYAKRKETIERVFADAKEKHGMRWTKLRGLKKVSMQAMLTFAAMNLKKLANWTWKGPCPA
ncbi:transposase [Bacillus safensis]